MVITLLIWSYVTFLAYVFGCFIIRLVEKNDLGRNVSFPIITLAGLAFLATLASYMSLFIKLGILANSFFLLLCIWIITSGKLIPLNFKVNLSANFFIYWIIIGLSFIVILESVTHIPHNSDTSLYHAQTIRWIETYRVVPGLGNLNGRLAFNSSWHILNALFSFSFLGLGSFHVIGGLLFFWVVAYWLQSILISPSELKLSFWVSASFILVSFYLLGSEISSPGTDMPATLLVWSVLVFLIREFEAENKSVRTPAIAIILLLFSILIKLSVAPASLIIVFILFYFLKNKESRSLKFIVGYSVFSIMPWVVRNLILSGYPVFPIQGIDIYSFDWKIPAPVVEGLRRGILTYARLPGRIATEGGYWSFTSWAPIWYGAKTFNQQLLLILGFLSPIGMFLRLRKRKLPTYTTHESTIKELQALFWGMYLGLIFWFLTAPSLRFGYVFLVGSVAIAYLPLLSSMLDSLEVREKTIIISFVQVGIVIFLGLFLLKTIEKSSIYTRILLPADYLPPIVDACNIDNINIYCARKWDQCNYDAFPCVLNRPKNVASRDGTLQGGFYAIIPEP